MVATIAVEVHVDVVILVKVGVALSLKAYRSAAATALGMRPGAAGVAARLALALLEVEQGPVDLFVPLELSPAIPAAKTSPTRDRLGNVLPFWSVLLEQA